MENEVPQNVIEVLASIRESGLLNMLSWRQVILMAYVADESAAKWLHENKKLYMEALNQMGAYISEETK